jgi:exodeoxyribonuclease-5
MNLFEEQRQALDTIHALRNRGEREIRFAGPAGTGKTTCIKQLLTELPEGTAVVVTPTNKAAKVLRSKGVPAATLYSVFFTPEDEAYGSSARGGKVRFIPNHTLDRLGEGKLRYADTIILDEASMLQTWLLAHLRKMCKTLILVGDQHQLPPVNDPLNPDGYFVTAKPHAALEVVRRQDEGSPILALATHIRNGRFPEALVRTLAPTGSFAEWCGPDRKIIAFTNAHRREVNMAVRRVLGFEGVLPKPGDRLICNDNHDDAILNGTEVKVIQFSWKMPDLLGKLVCEDEEGRTHSLDMNIARFLQDLPDGTYPAAKLTHVIKAGLALDAGLAFSYGYCITAHKAQGSEWDEVCVIDERWALNRMDASGNLARRHIYTSITRARQQLLFADFRWIKNAQAARRAA